MPQNLEDALYLICEEQNMYGGIFICPCREHAIKISIFGDEFILEVGKGFSLVEKGRWYMGDPKSITAMKEIISKS